jgi:uncharacterized protein
VNVLDVNVLVAWALTEHVHHARVQAWWEESRSAGEAFVLPDFVVAGFLRVATNAAVHTPPLGIQDAWGFLDDLAAQPTCLRWSGVADAAGALRELTEGGGVTSRLVSDAYIAACAIAVGGTLVTFDRDFRRFDGLRLRELV